MRCTRAWLPILILLPLVSVVTAGPFRRFRVGWIVLGKRIHRGLQERYQFLSILFKATCPVYPTPFPKEKSTRAETLQSLHEDIQARHLDLVKANEVYESALRAMAVDAAQDSAVDTELQVKSVVVQDAYSKVLDARSKYHLAVLHFARHLPPIVRLSEGVREAKSSVNTFLSMLADRFSVIEVSRRERFKFANNRIQSILHKGEYIVKQGTQSAINEHHRIIDALHQDAEGTVDDVAFLRALKVIADDVSIALADLGGRTGGARRTGPKLVGREESTGNPEDGAETSGHKHNNDIKGRYIWAKIVNLWKILLGWAKDKGHLTDGKWEVSSSATVSARSTASATWRVGTITLHHFLYFFGHPIILAITLIVISLFYFQARLNGHGKFLSLVNHHFGRRRTGKEFLIARQREETCTKRVSSEKDNSPWRRSVGHVNHRRTELEKSHWSSQDSSILEGDEAEKRSDPNRLKNRTRYSDTKSSELSRRRSRRGKRLPAEEKQEASLLHVGVTKNITITSDCDGILLPNTPGPLTRLLSRRLLHEETSASSTSSRRSTRHQTGSNTPGRGCNQ